MVEIVDKYDLKFNVTFGDFDALSLCYASTNCKTFSKGSKYVPNRSTVLLPEALVDLCCHQLDMTYNKAETFLSLGGEDELGDFMAHLKKIKLDKKTKKKK